MGNSNSKKREPNLHDDFHNSDLFRENLPGNYQFSISEYGKRAYGNLVQGKGERDPEMQKKAGGEDGRPTDEGGHIIGVRFQAPSDEGNVEAQDKNLNHSTYRIRENSWARSLDEGNQVMVSVETFHSNGSKRPDAYMGYSVTEHPDHTREYDTFSYTNKSNAAQEKWNAEAEKHSDLMDEFTNPKDYNPCDYEDELSDEVETSGHRKEPMAQQAAEEKENDHDKNIGEQKGGDLSPIPEKTFESSKGSNLSEDYYYGYGM